MAYLNETELFYCNGNKKCRDERISLARNVDIDFKTICVGRSFTQTHYNPHFVTTRMKTLIRDCRSGQSQTALISRLVCI